MYGDLYILPIESVSGNRFEVSIQRKDYMGPYSNLDGTNGVFVLKYVDNDEDVYPAIRASEATISFVARSKFDLESIVNGDDTEYRVVVRDTSGNNLWVGFLVTEDCTEQYTFPPKIISLRATDGLGLLKETNLQNQAGESVYDKVTLLQILEWCLYQTGIEIPLVVDVNVFESAMQDRSVDPVNEPFSQCKVHTRSFMTDATTYDNMYNVLSAILTGFKATLYQQNGRWHVKRFADKWNGPDTTATVYPYPYTNSTPTGETNNYDVLVDQVNYIAVNDDHIKGFVNRSKFTKITYNYEIPDDIPHNKSFQLGSFLSILSGPNNTAYRIDFWTLVKNLPEINSTATPYRNVVFAPGGGIQESYIVLPRETPGAANPNRLRSEPVEVQKGDRLSLSAETRTKTSFDISTGNIGIFYVRLITGSTTYTLRNDGQWIVSNANTVQFQPNQPSSADWWSGSVESLPFPDDGEVSIALLSWDASGTGNETWFRNVNIEFDIFLNNSTELKGEYDQISQNANYKKTFSEDIEVGDSPKKIIKGALFLDDGTTLTRQWHRQGKSENLRLIRLNDLALFQFNYRLKTKFDGSIKGVTYSSLLIGPSNLFSFTDIPRKVFIATNLTIDLHSDIAQVSLQEFYSDDPADPQGDTQTFNYIFG